MRSFLVRQIAVLRQQMPAEYLVPIALLLALSFGFLFVLLFHLTRVQDMMERHKEIALAEQAISSAVRLSDRDLRDYAIWDDAVIHLVQDFDQEWANNNLGPYLVDAQNYDYIFVLNDAGESIYTYSQGKRIASLDHGALLGAPFASALASVRNMRPGGNPLVAGFSRSGDELFIFAVSTIEPLTKRVVLPAGQKYVMAVARRLDLKFFEGAFNEHADISLNVRVPPQTGKAVAAFKTLTGDTIANLSWNPKKPGSALRREILPAFLIVGLICFCVAGLIVRRGRRSLEAIRLSENRARYHAEHDMLTGLPNRRALQSQLNYDLSRGNDLSLIYLDLDGFKETNDVYGHGTGDALLAAAAARMQDKVGADYTLARVGGDEFAIAVASDQLKAVEIAGEILTAFALPFTVGAYRVSLGISIGLASKEGIVDADELVRRADTAMYVAKARGKHCLQIYDPVLDSGRERRKKLETALRAAIEDDAVGVVFQNIVCARSRAVIGVEALARWEHPEFGYIPPDHFIPIAEASGLIVQLGRRILHAACMQARDWSIDLAVNLSPAQFWDLGLADTIEEVLRITEFPAVRLELEITEGYLMRRPEAARKILNQLKALGVRISLDDFGTGYASIGYLQQLGLDSIKIDKSFIAAVTSNRKAADLARAIIAIGDALEIPVTAEGVETRAQAELMQAAGCARLQGWLFGRPETAAYMHSQFFDQVRLAG